MRNSNKKQFLYLTQDSVLQPLISRLTEATVHRISVKNGQYFVGGYPKSGTTWICRMLANYLALPWFNVDDLVLGFNGVLHHHWNYHPSLAHTVYVVRDGRDVMVSVYMNQMKNFLARREALSELENYSAVKWLSYNGGRFATTARRFQYLYGKEFDPWDVEENLPKFIDYELQKPFIREAKLPWHLHVSSWLENAELVNVTRYEDLLKDAHSGLEVLIQQYLKEDPIERDVSYTVERFSFKRLTGRDPGEESRTSFARKGIQGDWRNYFNADAREIFNDYAGDLLVELGYERDHQWV